MDPGECEGTTVEKEAVEGKAKLKDFHETFPLYPGKKQRGEKDGNDCSSLEKDDRQGL